MKILIFSYNRVPINNKDVVEGTGLRAWRLAKGLVATRSIKVYIAVLSTNRQSGEKDGITVLGYSNSDDSIRDIIERVEPDTIISSYWMSGITKRIFELAPSNCQLIGDAYSPFYVEFFSNSGSKRDDKTILQWYPNQLEECNYVLTHADYVLVSNQNQEALYHGVIAGLGQDAYAEQDRFITVPGAVESSDRQPRANKIDNTRSEVLWFGGMYPWFDFSSLIDIFSDDDVAKIAYLRVVGGSNPMYKKTDKRYNGQYYSAVEQSKSKGALGKSIYFEDWVGYDSRLDIFASADCAVSINSSGPENVFSWRIRVADLAGNDVPVLTNGGDPLSETLIKKGLALRVDFDDVAEAKTDILRMLTDGTTLRNSVEKLSESHSFTHIYSYTETLAQTIKSHKRPRSKRVKAVVVEKLSRHHRDIRQAQSKVQELSAQLETANKERDYLRGEIDVLPKTLSQFVKRTLRRIVLRK